MHYDEVITRLNEAGRERRPCFFALDYEQGEGLFVSEPLRHPERLEGIRFSIGGYCTEEPVHPEQTPRILSTSPESYERYAQRYEHIYQGIQHGDSFLTNLTICTPIQLSTDSLEEVYATTRASYRLLVPGRFVCYSPETFVRIEGQEISTYPMKGTIDASLPDAEARLLGDYKEHCEHCTIVDLMRNDLSRVAERVRARRFKYLDRLRTSRGDILQMSSEVVGQLQADWHTRLGTLLSELLPAGSISGAPKERTCELIREAEGQPRGFYTGICGYYDGENLDTGVLIRFISERERQHYYHSGGGITINSQPEDEYRECLHKIYLPTIH